MDTFTTYAAATLGIALPLTALPLIGYLLYAVADLYMSWRREVMQDGHYERRKQPPYDEIRIIEYCNNDTVDIELVRNGEVVWKGEKDFNGGQSDPNKTTITFRKKL